MIHGKENDKNGKKIGICLEIERGREREREREEEIRGLHLYVCKVNRGETYITFWGQAVSWLKA